MLPLINNKVLLPLNPQDPSRGTTTSFQDAIHTTRKTEQQSNVDLNAEKPDNSSAIKNPPTKPVYNLLPSLQPFSLKRQQNGSQKSYSLAERFFKRSDEKDVEFTDARQSFSYKNKLDTINSNMISPTSKQIFRQLIDDSKRQSLKVSSDNLSGNILIYVKSEGPDRFKKSMVRSQELKDIELKIRNMQNDLEEIYHSKYQHKKLLPSDSIQEEDFQFITAAPAGIDVVLPSGFEQISQNSKANSTVNYDSNALLQPSIQNMVPKSQLGSSYEINASQKQSETITQSEHEHRENTKSSIKSSSVKDNGNTAMSKTASIEEYKQRLINDSFVNMRDQFTQVYKDYSKSIASLFMKRENEDPILRRKKKKKQPKFLICNSMIPNGTVPTGNEHLMRIYNKEHKPSPIQVCIPSFHPKKSQQDVIEAAYMQKYKPIKITKELKVGDVLPKYLSESIERDIQQLNSQSLDTPQFRATLDSNSSSNPQNSGRLSGDLNQAFIKSRQTSQETMSDFFRASQSILS